MCDPLRFFYEIMKKKKQRTRTEQKQKQKKSKWANLTDSANCYRVDGNGSGFGQNGVTKTAIVSFWWKWLIKVV